VREASYIVGPSDARPLGRPDECFYCHAPMGAEHIKGCVCRNRTVLVKVEVEMIKEVPEDWEPSMIEFGMNESSSCSNNLIEEVVAMAARIDAAGECMCCFVEGSFVREATAEDERRHHWREVPQEPASTLEAQVQSVASGAAVMVEFDPGDRTDEQIAASFLGAGGDKPLAPGDAEG